MTDSLVHPTPAFDPDDIEMRQYLGAFGQLEGIALERFYWLHLDWYEEHGFLADNQGLGGLLRQLDSERSTESLEDALRTLVDHWMIPTAIRSAIPPFDGWSADDRLAATKDAEAFRASE